jgi:hypothetical protein
MNLIDQVENILLLTIKAAEEHNFEPPKALRIHPEVLYKISLIEGWFSHPLFYVQDAGASRYGPNASKFSPVVNRVFVSGRALHIIEDPHIYFIALDFGFDF